MTVAELLDYLHKRSNYAVLDGSVADTLAKAGSGKHADPIMGEILNALTARLGADSVIDRATAATSLGPVRLKYMKDDAPVEGFRMVEKIIHTIDGAFNDEALREKYGR